MYTLLVIFYVLVSAALIGLVLIQHGKGADAGAAFGSGASGTVFGARGSANFLSRTTAWLAAVFFALSLTLAYFMHGRAAPRSVVDTAPAAPAPKIDVVPAAAQPPGGGAVKLPAGTVVVPTPAVPAPAAQTPSAAAPASAAPATPAPKEAPKPATPKVPD